MSEAQYMVRGRIGEFRKWFNHGTGGVKEKP